VPASFSPQRFGPYTLTARLGRGGMAEVFRARREGAAGFERTVVIKKIIGGHNEDPQFVEMFINEAKIAARLTHPNIVQVYELGEESGELFIAMEYVRGKDLLRLLRALTQCSSEAPWLPELQAAHVAREVCRGLMHAHERTDESGTATPIVHRDVSPQNIMLSYDGQVKLVDFGIAKALDTMKDETRSGALKGKFAYMAPEQVGGRASPSPQSDIFSTGVLLHEMLTGRRLFKGHNDYDTLERVQRMKVPLPSQLNPAVSSELDRITMHALERDRDRRYARAALMARDLDVFLQERRFAVDDMAALMDRVFPIHAREELADGAYVSSSYESLSREGGTPSSSLSLSLSSSQRSSSTARERHSARPQTPSRPGWWVGGALLLALAAATAAIYPLVRRRVAAAAHQHAIVTAAQVPNEHAPTATTIAPAPAAAPAPSTTSDVRLASEPPGAQVWQGPKLLGVTPVTVHAGGGTVAVTLIHPGYDELDYRVQPSDAPSLTLRLVRHRSAHKPALPHVQTAAPVPPPPRVPKVTPIDD
jgi:serine/threonine-protein kinase